MAKKWAKFPYPDKAYDYGGASLKKHWGRLHKGDGEPYPANAAAQQAWRHFHAGEFQQAIEVGNTAGGAGTNAAIKAQAIFAAYLEPVEKIRLALFEEAADWADARRKSAPKDANAHYLYAYALGRYGQGISVAKALAQGFGGKIKAALATALSLNASHAGRTPAFGAYQSEVINKVGGLVASITYGAKKESAIDHFLKALKLNPDAAIAHVEYANGLILLFAKARLDEATGLYKAAAACKPVDATERLDVELARSELE